MRDGLVDHGYFAGTIAVLTHRLYSSNFLSPCQPLIAIDLKPYFCNYQNMPATRRTPDKVVKYADMFSAMGTEARLRIMQLLLAAHPDGLVVGEIQEELDIPNSTLSHHLDKLRSEDLVNVSRESTFLRYTANTDALQEVLQFLYAECCTRNKALNPDSITQCCK
jgi:ArsR family transcriptional regulator